MPMASALLADQIEHCLTERFPNMPCTREGASIAVPGGSFHADPLGEDRARLYATPSVVEQSSRCGKYLVDLTSTGALCDAVDRGVVHLLRRRISDDPVAELH